MANSATDLVAGGYDAVYAAMPNSPTLQRLWREHALSADYPEGFESIGLVSLANLRRIAAELQLSAGEALVDLACGMGGPGLWIARETGAHLTGIDISPVAVAKATERASALGLSDQARFAVGSFAVTGLAAGAADAMMSIDALQYAPDKRAALAEAGRILRAGGRLVIRAFELDRTRAVDLPILGEDPIDDYQPLLKDAGFSVVTYEHTSVWPQRMSAACEAIMAAEAVLTEEMGQQAWLSLSTEISLTLQRRPYSGHVLAVAVRD